MGGLRARLEVVLLGQDVDQLEFWIGVAFLLRGGWMAYYQGLTVPPLVHEYIVPGWFSIFAWGCLVAAVGVGQIVSAIRGRSHFRAGISTAGVLLQGSGLRAYYAADAQWHGQVSYVIMLVLGEMFLAYRAWRAIFRKTGNGHGAPEC